MCVSFCPPPCLILQGLAVYGLGVRRGDPSGVVGEQAGDFHDALGQGRDVRFGDAELAERAGNAEVVDESAHGLRGARGLRSGG